MGCDEFGVAAYERLRGRMYAHREVEGWEDRSHQFGKEAGCWCEPTPLVPERRGSTSDARKRNAEKRATAPFAVREDEVDWEREARIWREDFPEPEWHKGKPDDTPDTGEEYDEYVPAIPSTSEYIRQLCREKLRLEGDLDEMTRQADWFQKFGLKWQERHDERRAERDAVRSEYDTFRQAIRELLDPDVSN